MGGFAHSLHFSNELWDGAQTGYEEFDDMQNESDTWQLLRGLRFPKKNGNIETELKVFTEEKHFCVS